MPSLPRLRRTRPRVLGEGVDARPQPRIAEVHAAELAWIHLEAVDPDLVNYLRSRFGWHALDVEDVLSKRQRPKVDDYADEGYLFGVLHFPAYDKNIQRLNRVPASQLIPIMKALSVSVGKDCAFCHVPDHWDPLARHGLNQPWTAGAIDRTGAQFQRLESGANRLFRRSHAVGS